MEKQSTVLKMSTTWFKIHVATLNSIVSVIDFKDELLNLKGGMEKQSTVLKILSTSVK